MKKLLLAAAAVIALSVTPFAVAAQQQNCGPREVVAERLTDNYGETRQMRALGANNTLVEVWASTEGSDPTGSWTITVTRPNGVTCLVASGQAYEALSESLVEGDPT